MRDVYGLSSPTTEVFITTKAPQKGHKLIAKKAS